MEKSLERQAISSKPKQSKLLELTDTDEDVNNWEKLFEAQHITKDAANGQPSSKSADKVSKELSPHLADGWVAEIDNEPDTAGDLPINFRNSISGLRTFFCPPCIDTTPRGWRKRLYIQDGSIVESCIRSL